MSKKNKALKYILWNPFEEEEKPDIIPLKKDVLPLPKKKETPHQSPKATASPQGEAKSGKSVLNSRRAGPFQKKETPHQSPKATASPQGEAKLSYKDKPGRTSKATLWTPQQQRAAEKKYGAQYYARAVAEYSGFSSAEIKTVIDKKESEKPAKFLAEQKWRDGMPEEAYSKLELSALNRLYEKKRTEEFEDNLKAQRQEFENTVKSADGFKNNVHHGSQMWTYSKKGFVKSDINRAVRILNDTEYKDYASMYSAEESVYGKNLPYTTDEEKQIIRALAARGDNEGFKKYYKIIERDLNARRQAAENAEMKEKAKEHPFLYGVPANVATTFALPLAYGATGFQAAKNAITGKYEPSDLNSPYFIGAHADEATRSGLEEKVREEGGGDVAVTLMDVGLGIGKNLVALPLGPTGALVSMGLSSAGDSAYDAQKRGATPGKAFAYSTAKGALEASTEKIPLDNLFDIAKSAGKGAVKEVSERGIKGALKSAAKVGREALPIVAKQSGIEGLEEVASRIGGNALDMAILGDNSNFNLLVEEYKKAGLSEAEARRAANFDLNVKGTGQALLGGVLSGGFMSTGAYSLGKVAGRSRGLPMPQFDEKIDFNDPNVGLVSDDYVANNLSKKVAESLDIVARALGVKVKFADEVDSGNANAEITGNEITIEKFNSNPLEFLLGHEVTHYMQEVSPAEYDAFKSAVLGEADVQAEAERLLSLYKEKGKNISADGALDEAVANYAGKLIRDTKVLDNFINKHRTDRNMLQRVLDGIRRVAAKLTGVEKRRAETAQGKLLAALEATAQNKNTAELGGVTRYHIKDNADSESNSIKEQLSQSRALLDGMNVAASIDTNKSFKNSKDVFEWALNTLKQSGNEVERQNFGTVILDEKRIKNGLRYLNSETEYIAYALIPKIIKRGVEIGEHNNHKNRGYSTVTFAAPVEINGKRGNMAVVVRIEAKNYYKLHRVVMPNGGVFEYKNRSSAERAAATQSVVDSPTDTTSTNSILDSQGKSNTNFEESFDNEGIKPRQSLKGSEALSDAEVSEALADIDNEQNVPTNQQNDAPKTAAQSVTDFAEKYIRNPLRWAYQRTVSGQAPLERLSKGQRALNGDQSITAEDLVQQVRGAGGIVDAVLEDGLFNIDGTRMEMGGERAPSWREMTARIPRGKEADFNTYLQHRHNVDRVAQGTPLLAVSAEESQRTVNTLEAQNPEFKALAEEFYSYWDLFMREWAVGGGLLSEEAYTRFREMYPSYIPGFRVDTMSAAAKAAGRGMPVGTRRAIRNAEGGSSEIMDIRDSFPIYINRFIKYQRQNDLYLNLAEWARENPVDAAEMGIVLPGNARQGESRETSLDIYEALSELENNGLTPGMFNMHTVTAFEDGKRVSVNVNQDIYEALDFLVNPKMGDIQKIARTITGLSKNMITQYNPIFVATNMMKDFQTGYIHSMQHNPLKYTARVFEAGKEIAENSERFREYKALGGARSGFYSRSDGFVESHGKKYGESDNKFKDTVKKVARGAGRIADVSEQAVRFAEYLNYLEKHGDTPENRRKAVLAAADITTNFSRSGPATKAADSITMYLNAGVQGVDKMRRQMSDKKTAFPTLLKAGISNALMSGIIGSLIPAIFGGTPNEENPHYKELTEYVKDNNYILPNIWNKDENGYPKTFFKIPKSREYGAMFGGAYNRIAGALTGDKEAFDERSMREWGKNIANNVAPASPFTDSLPMAMRDIWAHNKDWAGSSIVPQSMQELSPQNQYDAGTSEISKAISKVLPISPMKLDETIRAFGGSTYGEGLLKLGTKSNDGIAGKLADIFLEPVKSKFTADPLYSSKSVSKFFDDKERAITAAKDRNIEENLPSDYRTPEEVRVTAYNKAADEMADLMNEERRLLNTMPNTPARKALIDAIRAKRIELARGAEGNAESAYSEYAKNYVPEISMLSPKAQATARTMNEKYGVSYDTFKTLTGETLADADSSEATQEKFTKALPLPVQEFVNSTKKEESNAELRRYLIFNTEGLSPEAKSELDKYLSGGELKNPVDYTDEESFYYSLLTEAKQKRYGEAHSRWGNLTKKKYYKIIDACRGLKKKADIIAELERQGFWGDAPYQFYSIVFK